MPGAGSGPNLGLNLNLGVGRDRADSTLVNRQTSIIADQRLDVRIEGHTQLDGSLIASLMHHPVKWAPVDGQDDAQKRDLSLDTGTLGFSDITERARSDSRRASLTIGLGGSVADGRGGWSCTGTPNARRRSQPRRRLATAESSRIEPALDCALRCAIGERQSMPAGSAGM